MACCVKSDFNLEEGIWTVLAAISKMGKIIRRPIFPSIEPLLKNALLTYNEHLFPGEDLKKPITIAAANRFIGRVVASIDIAAYSFTSKPILLALIEAKDRGVFVRVMADKKSNKGYTAVTFLANHHTPVRLNSSYEFMVIDSNQYSTDWVI